MTRSDHPAAAPREALLADCRIRLLRRSGPGGQHRNKVETAVQLQHVPTGVSAEASERRSQAENRAVALFRLRVNLALRVRSSAIDSETPSPLWQGRCRGGRIAVNAAHDDFPALLAEALDGIARHGWDTMASAQRLGCTASQLVKLFKKEPRALALVNQQRAARNLRPLR